MMDLYREIPGFRYGIQSLLSVVGICFIYPYILECIHVINYYLISSN